MTDVSEQSVAAKWKDLAIRAIDCVHDAERETNWGQSTFGPSVWEGLRNEQNDLLAAVVCEAELLALVRQYRNDLCYPVAEDSRVRRLAAIDAVLAKVTAA